MLQQKIWLDDSWTFNLLIYKTYLQDLEKMLKLEIFTLRAYNPKSTFKFKEFWKAIPCKLQNLKLEHSNKHQEAY